MTIAAYDSAFPADKTEGVLTVNVRREEPIVPNNTVVIVTVADSFPLSGELVQLRVINAANRVGIAALLPYLIFLYYRCTCIEITLA